MARINQKARDIGIKGAFNNTFNNSLMMRTTQRSSLPVNDMSIKVDRKDFIETMPEMKGSYTAKASSNVPFKVHRASVPTDPSIHQKQPMVQKPFYMGQTVHAGGFERPIDVSFNNTAANFNKTATAKFGTLLGESEIRKQSHTKLEKAQQELRDKHKEEQGSYKANYTNAPVLHMQFDQAASDALFNSYECRFVKQTMVSRRNPVKYMRNPN